MTQIKTSQQDTVVKTNVSLPNGNFKKIVPASGTHNAASAEGVPLRFSTRRVVRKGNAYFAVVLNASDEVLRIKNIIANRNIQVSPDTSTGT